MSLIRKYVSKLFFIYLLIKSYRSNISNLNLLIKPWLEALKNQMWCVQCHQSTGYLTFQVVKLSYDKLYGPNIYSF
jgi:hypothetical protein